MDPLERIEGKIDTIREAQVKIREIIAMEAAKLSAHLIECSNRDSLLHKRIDKIEGEQSWWSRKLFGSAVGGGMVAEFVRWVTGNHHS